MPIITPERASEIRGELCEKHGATWLHHYHEAIEAEVSAHWTVLMAATVAEMQARHIAGKTQEAP